MINLRIKKEQLTVRFIYLTLYSSDFTKTELNDMINEFETVCNLAGITQWAELGAGYEHKTMANILSEWRNKYLGSVVCRNYGTISDVYAVYSVTSAGINNNNPAGLVARNDGTMRNCIAEVTTDEGYANKGSVGAIAGYSSVTSMTNCYAIVNDASVGIMNGRGTTPSDKVPTCKAYVGKSAFFAAYEKGEADTSAYSEYWHFDREKETIIFGA